MPQTPAANRFDGAKNRAVPSHVSSAAACEYIDLTNSGSPSPSLAPAARETGPSREVIDLTTVDNPCYDPNETGYIPNRQKATGTDSKPNSAQTSPEPVTWDMIFPLLPMPIQEQTDNNRAAVPAAQKEGSADSYADEFLDDNTESLIEMTDRVESQMAAAAGKQASVNSRAGSSTSGAELCPICNKGCRVKKTFHRGNKAQVGFRCSDATCWYEELDE